MALKRHEKQALAGGAGLALATSGNRIVDRLNDRVIPRFGAGMEAGAQERLQAAKDIPRSSSRMSGMTWAERGQARAGKNKWGEPATLSRGAMRRAANQVRAQEIKQAQGSLNTARRVKNFRLGYNSRVAVVGTGLLTGVPMSLSAVRGGAREQDRVRKAQKRTALETTNQALAGGAAGAATYYGAMYGSKPIMDRRYNARQAKGAKDPATARRQKQLLEEHRQRTGVSGAAQGDGRWKQFHREYPEDLPGAKWKRASSHLFAGKRGLGVLVGTASVGGAYGVTRDNKKRAMQGPVGRGRKQNVEKALFNRNQRQAPPTYYYQDQTTSAPRAGGVAAGAGLIALGAPRARMIGAMSAAGQRSDLTRPNVKRFLAQSDVARNRLVRGTQPAVDLIHRTKGVGGLVDLVPARLRPYVAAGAGVSLIQRSVPVRRTTYRPVQGDPYGGW